MRLHVQNLAPQNINRETVLLEDGSLCNFRRPTNPPTVASRKVDKLWFALILSGPLGDSFWIKTYNPTIVGSDIHVWPYLILIYFVTAEVLTMLSVFLVGYFSSLSVARLYSMMSWKGSGRKRSRLIELFILPFVVKGWDKLLESCFLAEIRTEHRLNPSLEPYCYMHVLGRMWEHAVKCNPQHPCSVFAPSEYRLLYSMTAPSVTWWCYDSLYR
jgi:hypothetical protein